MIILNPIISVIVPIYNTEKFLDKSIGSVLAQTFSDFEIIAINDGSTDNSLEKISSLSQNDNRIKVYTKQNGGQSSARNFGIKKASGKYICFVDSDDYIEPTMLSTLFFNTQKTNSDISICSFRIVKDGKVVSLSNSNELIKFNQISVIETMLAEKYILFSVCACLYKRDLFNNIRFPEGVLHEDVLIIYQFLRLCEKVCFQDISLYNYILNSSSSMGKPFTEKRLNDIKAREEIVSLIKNEFPNLYENAMNIKLVGYLNIINKILEDGDKKNDKYLIPLVKQVNHDKNLYLKNNYINKNKKIGVFLLSIGIWAYKFGMKVLKKIRS